MIIPCLADGGAERVVSNLTQQMSKKYEITLLLDYNKISYPYKGRLVCLSDSQKEPSGLAKIRLYIKKSMFLWNAKRNKEYDFYISHSFVSNLLNVLSGKNQKKTIITVHNNIFRKQKDCWKFRFENYLLKKIYPFASRIVVVSKEEKNKIVEYLDVPGKKVIAIWNGSNISEIMAKSGEELGEKYKNIISNSKHTVTTVGRYVDEKGQWHLIRAFSKVVERFPDAKLLLVGDGYLRNYLSRVIDEIGLKQNVFLCGFDKNPFNIIANSSVFAFSSVSEGFGYVLEEAMCCGVPCVSTDFDFGAREIMESNEDFENVYPKRMFYGTLTARCSEKKYNGSEPLENAEMMLAHEIIFMLENKDYCDLIVKRNRERICVFSVEEMAKKWMMLLEEDIF